MTFCIFNSYFKFIWHCFFPNKSIYLSYGRQITLLFWPPPYNHSIGRKITLLFWRPPDNPSSGRQITLLFWRPRDNSSSGRQITLLFWRLPYNFSFLAAARLRQINYIKLYFISVTYGLPYFLFRFVSLCFFLFFSFSFVSFLFSLFCFLFFLRFVFFFSFLFVAFLLVFFSFFFFPFLFVSFRFFPFLSLQVPCNLTKCVATEGFNLSPSVKVDKPIWKVRFYPVLIIYKFTLSYMNILHSPSFRADPPYTFGGR